MATMTWSIYQQDIFKAIRETVRSILVQAVAGAGKTRTLEEIYRILSDEASHLAVIAVAFGADIAKEMAGRGIPAQTLNSIAYRACLREFKCGQPNTGKVRRILRENLTDEQGSLYGSYIPRMVALAMTMGVVPQAVFPIENPKAAALYKRAKALTQDTDGVWLDMMDEIGVYFTAEQTEAGASPEELIFLCRATLLVAISEIMTKRDMSFDDHVYSVAVFNIALPQYDVVMVDELQDLNLVQRAMVRKLIRAKGRFVGFGDRRQSIYAWRGADAQSMDAFLTEFDCIELPLSVSYRCAKAIVAEAQKFSTFIESAPNAPEGKVETLGKWNVNLFTNQDFVLCRNNAPLVALAFKLMRAHKQFKMLGRAFGQNVISLLKSMGVSYQKSGSGEAELSWLGTALVAWRDREIARAQAQDNATQEEQIGDIYATINVLLSDSGCTTIDCLIQAITSLFSQDTGNGPKDSGGVLTLSSVHRAKGKEANRVFILDPALMPSKMARTATAIEQERNLQYVAVTRAKQYLAMIESGNRVEAA